MKLALALCLVSVACSKPDAGGAAGATASARDKVIDAWKTGGLAPTPFAATQVAVGKDCSSGTVNQVDVIVCQFATPDEAKKAEDAGYAWVGDTTGMSQARGSLLIAAADRKKADKNGKTINQLMKLAPK